MPQTTLMGYFLPVQSQPSYIQSIPVVQGSNPQATNVPSKSKDPANATDDETPEPALLLNESPILASLNNDGPDFFVPSGRPRAAVVKVLPSHVARLKSITSILLPVRYPDRFYNECLDDTMVADVSRVLLWDTQPVGWIRCRIEDNDQGHKQIYVQALGVLAPYRGSGLATSLLEQVTKPTLIQKYDTSSIYCHVWEANQDALDWYEKRGFRRVILLDHYYRKLRPAAAWIMRKELT